MGAIARDLHTPSAALQVQTLASAISPPLYLIRHAQAEHNVNPSHVSRRDTVLTETGRLQAVKLQKDPSDSSRRHIGAVVASPLRRALQTALIGFENLILPDKVNMTVDGSSEDSAAPDQIQSHSQPLRLVALPEAQETSDLPCNIGLPVADIAAEFDAPGGKWRLCVDFDMVSAEEWGSKTGRWACDRETLEQRARKTRRWLREMMRQLSLNESSAANMDGEKLYVRGDCVLVTHGGFLRLLTEDWEGFDINAGTGWANTKVRAYHFVAGIESETDANATIEETEESRRTRLEDKKLGSGPEITQQTHPEVSSLAAWDDGLVKVES